MIYEYPYNHVPNNTSIVGWLPKVSLDFYNTKDEYYAVIFEVGGTLSVGVIQNFDGCTGVEFRTFQLPFSHQI